MWKVRRLKVKEYITLCPFLQHTAPHSNCWQDTAVLTLCIYNILSTGTNGGTAGALYGCKCSVTTDACDLQNLLLCQYCQLQIQYCCMDQVHMPSSRYFSALTTPAPSGWFWKPRKPRLAEILRGCSSSHLSHAALRSSMQNLCMVIQWFACWQWQESIRIWSNSVGWISSELKQTDVNIMTDWK